MEAALGVDLDGDGIIGTKTLAAFSLPPPPVPIAPPVVSVMQPIYTVPVHYPPVQVQPISFFTAPIQHSPGFIPLVCHIADHFSSSRN
jgi:hypothetical protein